MEAVFNPNAAEPASATGLEMLENLTALFANPQSFKAAVVEYRNAEAAAKKEQQKAAAALAGVETSKAAALADIEAKNAEVTQRLNFAAQAEGSLAATKNEIKQLHDELTVLTGGSIPMGSNGGAMEGPPVQRVLRANVTEEQLAEARKKLSRQASTGEPFGEHVTLLREPSDEEVARAARIFHPPSNRRVGA
jgi:hypothetical protein